MTKEIKKSMELGGRTLTLETGTMARQSAGSILLTYGETVILVAVNSSSSPREGIDFFPLSVEYRERGYAAGKIPGGYFKREGRPTEKEILAARLTDRPIRPLFPEGFRCETQIFINLLSTDQENPADTLGTIGTSVALMSSDIPWNGPIAAVRVGLVNDKMILNPTYEQIDDSKIDMVVTGNEESIIMMEGESKEASEDEIFSAVQYAHEAIKDIIKFQIEFSSELSIEKREFDIPQIDADLETKTNENIGKRMTDILKIQEKGQRKDAQSDLTNELIESMEEEFPDQDSVIRKLVTAQYKKELRSNLLKEIRVDGRNMDEIRTISIKLGFLPRTHGSSLFTRGETQSLCTITLGSKSDEQYVDDIDGEFKKKYMLHYNFPPFSVGEIKRYLGLSRREVGHGNLAERALKSILPKFEDFPYTIRVVSDILESNGSSSMASVCAGSLALMDAGVPIISPVAGVTVGLVKDGKKEVLFSDILGEEDHFGDMDFKVVGTSEGITALQMDIKIRGLSREIVEKSLKQARDGRLHILEIMNASMEEPRNGLSSYAPRFITHKIPRDLIGKVIGPGGKVIKDIIEKTGVKMNIDDDGIVSIASREHKAVDVALGMVKDLTRTVEIGQTYTGPVKKVMDFGAFVELFPGTEGLVHISNLAPHRVNTVTDICREGDIVTVKAMGMDKRGKLQLSMKDVEEAA